VIISEKNPKKNPTPSPTNKTTPSPVTHPITARSHEDGAIGLGMKEDLAVLREAKEHPCFLVAENPWVFFFRRRMISLRNVGNFMRYMIYGQVYSIYPLVNIQKAIENGPRKSEFSLE
jgi:hypothetical protein